MQAIVRELDEKADDFAGKELVSIYFGGGTPSIWDVDCVAKLIQTLRERFATCDDLEISMECNPVDCRPEAFARWKQAGINRVLVGVQATNAQDLVTLGRDHSMGDGQSALKRVVSEGFKSVGADVILGVPGSVTPLKSLRAVAEIGPPHLSAYELTIEERTSFGARVAKGELICEDEDALADLYLQAHDILVAKGYEHYEVSSYAKPGHRSRHNSLYWRADSYLGLGNGAASLWVGEDGRARRWQNKRSVSGYLRDNTSQHAEFTDEVSIADFAMERLWLAMRTVDGAPESWLEGREDVAEKLLEEGLLLREAGMLRPTLRGFLYNNQLITRLGVL